MPCRLRVKALPAAVLLSSPSFVATSQFGCSECGVTPEKSARRNSCPLTLRTTRSSPLDLELGGELRGVPAGSTRYLTRADLLALPQTNAYVSDDPNFARPVQIGGVLLEELARRVPVSERRRASGGNLRRPLSRKLSA